MVTLNFCTPCGGKRVRDVKQQLENLFDSNTLTPETCCICCKPMSLQDQVLNVTEEHEIHTAKEEKSKNTLVSVVTPNILSSGKDTWSNVDLRNTLPEHAQLDADVDETEQRVTPLRTGTIKREVCWESFEDEMPDAGDATSSDEDFAAEDLESSNNSDAEINEPSQEWPDEMKWSNKMRLEDELENEKLAGQSNSSDGEDTNTSIDEESSSSKIKLENVDDTHLKLKAFRPEVLDLLDKEFDGKKPFRCRQCGNKKWSSLNPLLKHLSTHDEELIKNPFTCKGCCNRQFITFEDWCRHTKPYQCRFASCELKFATRGNLTEHEKTHSKEKPFKCKQCGKSFTISSYLTTHIKCMHPPPRPLKPLSPGDHGIDFTTKPSTTPIKIESTQENNLQPDEVHESDVEFGKPIKVNKWTVEALAPEVLELLNTSVENSRTSFQCKYCVKQYISINYFLTHVSMHTNKGIISEPYQCKECCKQRFKSIQEWKEHTKPYKCNYHGCTYRVASKYSFSQHEKTHSIEKKYQCELCAKYFKTPITLDTHVKAVHERLTRFSCDYCDFKFYHRANFVLHQRTHTREKPFHCECGKSFTSAIQLKYHKMDHTGEKPFVCDQCGFQTKSKRSLTLHEQTHSSDRRYQCDECGVTVSTKSWLKRHKQVHTGIKHIKCRYCDKRFMYEGPRIRHEKTHPEWTGIREYVCTECGRDCHSKQKLHLHTMSHTGEKPFQCSYCDYRSSRPGNVRTHQRRHTGEQPYQCKGCKKRFMYVQPCRYHEKACSLFSKVAKEGDNEGRLSVEIA